MSYKGWKMMDKIDVAIKTSPSERRVFNGYVAEHGDEKALESAKDWAREREYDYDKREYVKIYDPEVHIFDNGGFTVRILESAGGSSQGGRLSFMACEVEKDGIKFVIGVNDELLVDLIRNSEISKGIIKEKVMFVRKAGRPGFIHEGMDAYKEANADMKQKADLKKAKKTSKWEIGGVYSTLTQNAICIGDVWDTMQEYQDNGSTWPYRHHTILKRREAPVKVTAWMSYSKYDEEAIGGMNLTRFLERHIENKWYWFTVGKPPARFQSQKLEVTENDLKLIDKLLSSREDYINYGDPRVKGRYVREIKK